MATGWTQLTSEGRQLPISILHEPSGRVALAKLFMVFTASEPLDGFQILDRNTALKLIDGLASFYNTFSQEQIDTINAKIIDGIKAEQEERKRFEHELICRNADAQDGPGFVYLLTRSDGLVKIGFTRSLPDRYKTLCREHGELQQTHVISTHWPRYCEARLHHLYREKRVELEWFTLSLEDVEYIKSLTEKIDSWLIFGDDGRGGL